MTNIVNLFKKGTTVVLAVLMSLTLLNVITGGISVSANTVGTTAVGGLTDADFTDESNETGDGSAASSIVELLINIVQILIYIIGAVAVIFLVYGGFLFIVDPGGSGDGATKGKTIIFNALIGLVIVLIATGIVQLVTNLAVNNGFI